MTPLYQRSCRDYSAKRTAISSNEVAQLKSNIPSWKNELHDGKEVLMKEFLFSEYQDAFTFVSAIVALSEIENHHPKIIIEWGKVTVLWWSHSINGLHLNDFIMAAKTDMINKN